jgi:hypothetical protein
MASPVQLSKVSVDFDALYDDIRNGLLTKESWKDLLVSGAGRTLMEFMAATGVYNQYNIEMALREAFLTTALRDSSIYSLTRLLGVKISRKYPASIVVVLTNFSDSVVRIPPKSRFNVGIGRPFFNRVQINIPPRTTIGADPSRTSDAREFIYLYEGQPKSLEVDVKPESFLEYQLGEPGFVVTEQDLEVMFRDKTSGSTEAWQVVDRPLWEFGSDDAVFYENTTGSGDVSLLFGDGTYGRKIPSNSKLVVNYVVTSGSLANINSSNNKVFYADNPAVAGDVKTSVYDGLDEKPAKFYKIYAPHIFKARTRAVTTTDYKALILSRGDVASVTVQGQRETHPEDPSWMNVVRICVLPSGSAENWGGVNPNPRSGAWTAFLEWLQPKAHAAIQFQTWNPTKRSVTVKLRVALKSTANWSVVVSQIEDNIRKLFVRDENTLGRSLYRSDLSAAAMLPEVDYVIIDSPTEDVIVPDRLTYLSLGEGALDVTAFYSERSSLPTRF